MPNFLGVSVWVSYSYLSWVREHLDDLPHSFTITDPWIPGHPIVFASKELLKRSGYSRQEVVGNNGRIFHGIKTNRREVMEIRQAVREERTIQLTLLNYMKNGTPFFGFASHVSCFQQGRWESGPLCWCSGPNYAEAVPECWCSDHDTGLVDTLRFG
ncbi:putative non-specific serine/threonine protein kinase [Helianthus anomalus]